MIMKEEITNRKGSILTPVLAGGALGAGLALLLAPKSGKEIREDLKRAAGRLSQAIDIGKDLYGESRVFVNKAVEASKKAYTEEKPLEPIIIRNGRGSRLEPIMRAGLIGAGIGAGIALLLAPKPGRDTREDVKHFALSAREKVVSAIDKGKEAITGEGTIPYVDGKREDMHVV